MCGFEGRAIYADVDFVFHADLAELWREDMPGVLNTKRPKPAGKLKTCCTLFDCAKAKGHIADLDALKRMDDPQGFYSNYFKDRPELVSNYQSGEWNAHDIFDLTNERIKATHYTRMEHQVHLKHAIRRQMLSVEQEHQERDEHNAAADAKHAREKSGQEPERQISEPPRLRAPCFHALIGFLSRPIQQPEDEFPLARLHRGDGQPIALLQESHRAQLRMAAQLFEAHEASLAQQFDINVQPAWLLWRRSRVEVLAVAIELSCIGIGELGYGNDAGDAGLGAP